MGIVFKQSVRNVLTTYLGFLIGAVNTLFLFTHFLSKQEYGLVGYILSTATILTPLMAFGVHNTLIRYYVATPENERPRFTLMMLWLPLLMILPLGIVGQLFYESIVSWLSSENEIVAEYVPVIYYTAIAMAYFEVFYAWMRIQLKSVFGNFLKEVFHRVGVSVLLGMIFLKIIDFHQLVYALLGIYVLRTLVMAVVALRTKLPTLEWGLPKEYRSILVYSFFIILSGSVASLLIDIDKFMLNQYLPISQIAIYNVAVFTATVVVIPYRAMYQIISPLTASLLHKKDTQALSDLYQRSTLNVYLAGMLIFLWVVLNAKQLYALIPSEGYELGFTVLILISLVKLSDTLVGINNALLFNSHYYKNVLYFGLFLVVCMVGLNMIFIPLWGINGAAFATMIAFFLYNGLKLGFVYRKYQLHPFHRGVIGISLMGLIIFILGFFWDFPFHPLLNILLKSLLIIALCLIITFKFRLSDLVGLVDKVRKLKS